MVASVGPIKDSMTGIKSVKQIMHVLFFISRTILNYEHIFPWGVNSKSHMSIK